MPTRRKLNPKLISKSTSASATAAAIKSKAQSPLLSALGQIQELEGQIAQTILATQEKVQQLELLTQVSTLLNSSLDPSVVREKALEATCQLVKCETASLFLVDSKTGELYWETALGNVGKELQKSVRLPINNRSIAGYVAMTGEPLLIHDVAKDPRHFKKAGQSSGFETRTMICVPLLVKERVIGVLQAINKLSSLGDRATSSKSPVFGGDDLSMVLSLASQVAVAIENSRLYSGLKRSFYDTVEALAESIEKKDSYTGGHTKRVVHYSMCIAKYLDLTEDELERVRLGALLHDVGKIGVEDKILKKAAPLDESEWVEMMKHPDIGFSIMARVESLQDVIAGMRYHHERWDGKGYPLKLRGEEIPLIARIIAVADTYDAMISTRPYRKGLATSIALEEISRHGGTQFDPRVVEAFKKAFANEKMGPGSGGSRYGHGSSDELYGWKTGAGHGAGDTSDKT